jgi:uncharacterized cupredoxin-like copper-binding protein
MHRLPFTALALSGALVLVACGEDDAGSDAGAAAGDATRTVEVDMVDIAFEPETLDVERGETIRFVFTNDGAVAHDAFVGDADAQAEHESEMLEDDDAHGGHGDDEDEGEDAVTVEPGETAELTYTFEDAGTFEIGCHQEGHYEAGMKITVEVA